jgi:hypothetical protein
MGLAPQTTKTLLTSRNLFLRQNEFKPLQTRENSNQLHKELIY